MNRIEKMSKEAAEKHYSEQNVFQHDAFMKGFQEGFRAAKMTAAQILKNWDVSWYDEDTKLVAQVHDRWTQIERLGESDE